MRKIWIGLALAGFAVLTLAWWSLWVEPRRLVVHEAELSVPAWPSALSELRITVITDLHVGSPHHGLGTLREIVATVNGTRPDVVLITGDLVILGVVGGRFVEPEPIAGELGQLRARLGVFAVLGNHDWWFDAPRVEAALENAGISVLEDESVPITVNGEDLWLAGVSDYWEGRHDIGAALAGVPEDRPVVLFTHNPDIFPEVPERVSLTVAGHTHGGQVYLPLIGRPVVPSRFGQRYAAGHVVEGGRHLFVSTGLGTSILPIRFRVPPEVAVLTLTSISSQGPD